MLSRWQLQVVMILNSFYTPVLDTTLCDKVCVGAIKNEQCRETGNIQDEKKHNTICFGDHYTQTNTNNVNET
jgi:hypothetical protein